MPRETRETRGQRKRLIAPQRDHSSQRKITMRPRVLEGAEARSEETRNVCEDRVPLEKHWETARAVHIFPKGEEAGLWTTAGLC